MKKICMFVLILTLLVTLVGCGGQDAEQDLDTETQTSDDNEICRFENDICAYRVIDVLDGEDYTWSVELSNKTDAVLVFSMDQVYLNDCKLDPYWAVSVAAHSTVKTSVSWDSASLDHCKIDAVTRADFTLHVYDGDAVLVETALTLYPEGESAYAAVERIAQNGETVLLETEEYTVVAIAFDADAEQGCTLSLYLCNNSQREVTFCLNNLRINGQSADPNWLSELGGGKYCYETLSWSKATLSAKEITTVTGMSFDVMVCDADGTTVLRKEHISLNI